MAYLRQELRPVLALAVLTFTACAGMSAPPAPAPPPRPTLVFSLDQGFGSGFIPNYDDVALDRILAALQPLQESYRVCVLVNPQVSARDRFDALLDTLAARRVPFVFDVYSSDGHTLGCWNPPNTPHDVRHGVTISIEELDAYRKRHGPWLAGLRIMEVFAHDFTIRAVKTTNPEWGNPHWVNPDDDFFQPAIAEGFLRFAREHGMFVQWSDWHWHAFAGWDPRQKPFEEQMAALLRQYPGTVIVTYANNEPSEKSEDRFGHWEQSVAHFVEAGAAGYGLSDQSWLRKDHLAATPGDIVRWADGAFDRGCRFVQFEPMWFFFAWCVGTSEVQDPRLDKTWESRGTPTPAFRKLAEALSSRAARREAP
jgi:hypothetical protein